MWRKLLGPVLLALATLTLALPGASVAQDPPPEPEPPSLKEVTLEVRALVAGQPQSNWGFNYDYSVDGGPETLFGVVSGFPARVGKFQPGQVVRITQRDATPFMPVYPVPPEITHVVSEVNEENVLLFVNSWDPPPPPTKFPGMGPGSPETLWVKPGGTVYLHTGVQAWPSDRGAAVLIEKRSKRLRVKPRGSTRPVIWQRMDRPLPWGQEVVGKGTSRRSWRCSARPSGRVVCNVSIKFFLPKAACKLPRGTKLPVFIGLYVDGPAGEGYSDGYARVPYTIRKKGGRC